MVTPKVIAIVGPTASGKSSLAIELALRLNGEVVSADSRQVYRGMDIGTGKVTTEEMRGIPHHLISIANPATETYTATNFTDDANAAITNILSRGKTPIICGGTFFYLDILRGKMGAAPVPPNETLRRELEALSTDELLARLTNLDQRRAATIDTKNPRRLMRAIEIATALGAVPEVVETESPYEWTIIGIDIEPELLRERIARRLEERLANGMIEEVVALHESGVSWERLQSFGLEYRYISKYIQGDITEAALRTELFYAICGYAKRQRTWLRRDHDITWLPFPVDSIQTLSHLQSSGFMVR
ncbi:tRNA (adenosine(37)-N6)-dimethylallyltransferase MiaA [Patescibacteria group bacterium]|nr:tRNA (adenosine(37)-N6)-dimethylallyltransferase MiaA [Patescibacteria group bacterium]